MHAPTFSPEPIRSNVQTSTVFSNGSSMVEYFTCDRLKCRLSGNTVHTSVRRCAVRSRILLWLMDGNPPLAQERTCGIENDSLQAQWEGITIGLPPIVKCKRIVQCNKTAGEKWSETNRVHKLRAKPLSN